MDVRGEGKRRDGREGKRDRGKEEEGYEKDGRREEHGGIQVKLSCCDRSGRKLPGACNNTSHTVTHNTHIPFSQLGENYYTNMYYARRCLVVIGIL